MKLLIAGFVALLALPSLAAADDLCPPGGPVYDEPPPQEGAPPQQQRGCGRNRARVRAAVIARFDANGDGQLQPQERRRAKQAIRAKRVERFIQRFDTDHDGNVGPDEIPPGAAHKLRRLDRNGDGWVQPGERRQQPGERPQGRR